MHIPPSLSRKLLHLPFFPLSSSSPPPAQPPSLPKYPSSTSQKPFFPSNPSPPPPPPSLFSSLPTFPANFSSLITPSPHSPSTKLLKAIAFPLLSLALLSLLLLLLFFRRTRRKKTADETSDCDRLFPPNSAPSDCRKPVSSEFLYLGTLVNSRGEEEGSSSLPVRSPELRPLPPLAREVRKGEENRGFSSPEEFYSPKGAVLMRGSGSRLDFYGPERRGSTFSSLSSASYHSSNVESSGSSSSPVGDRKKGGFGGFRPPAPPMEPSEDLVSRKDFVVLPPAPPPPPARQSNGVLFCGGAMRPKLKALHWDKVKACSDREMVWDQMKSSSFQLNEEMIETLFVCDRKNMVVDGGRKVISSTAMQQNVVLDAKKSQNIAILLRALNVTKEEVCEALLDGNNDALGNELLETLLRMAPSKEEELKLREYNDNSPFKLGPAENFLKAVLDIPFAFKRVEAMLYIANFDSEVNYLKKSFETLETACEELRSSRLFLKLLEAVLKTGNRMNVGTNRGDAQAFKLDTLLKLVDVKGTDGKTTLLHFVVQEIIRAEGSRHSAAKLPSNAIGDDLEYRRLGLQIVSGLGNELGNVKNSAGMDCDMLTSSVLKLAGGIGKVREVLRLNEVLRPVENHQRFQDSMISFLKRAEVEIVKIQVQESVALSLVREITEYFHGNSTKEEAHPFRIFMIVRDFLNILNQVCKEIGRINERTSISLARKPSTRVSQMSPPGFPKFRAARSGSSDDESSS